MRVVHLGTNRIVNCLLGWLKGPRFARTGSAVLSPQGGHQPDGFQW